MMLFLCVARQTMRKGILKNGGIFLPCSGSSLVRTPQPCYFSLVHNVHIIKRVNKNANLVIQKFNYHEIYSTFVVIQLIHLLKPTNRQSAMLLSCENH